MKNYKLDQLNRVASEVIKPPEATTVSECVEGRRYLSMEASAEAGPWRNENAPHLVLPMDCLSPDDVAERVVCEFSAQSGKTEILLNFCYFIIDMDPGPTLVVQPNMDPMGETFSKDRLSTMLRDSPDLHGKVSDPKSRDSKSTIKQKSFPGGHITIAGANSPASLASRPIRYFLGDELGLWIPTRMGDPLMQARKRLQTYRVRGLAKEILVSTSTYRDVGITPEREKCSRQYERQLKCKHCGEYQAPELKHFDLSKMPSAITYACGHCGGVHDESDEYQMKLNAEWILTKDESPRSVGFLMAQWASPLAKWDQTAQEWLDAEGDKAAEQVVINTVFAKPYDAGGAAVEPSDMTKRCTEFPEKLDKSIGLITIGVDVQLDRLEAEVIGWNALRQSWSLDYVVLPGSPMALDVWEDLTELFNKAWPHENGALLTCQTMCVDSGAFTQHVYDYVKRMRDQRIIPIKGVAGMGKDQYDSDFKARMSRLAKRLRTGKPPEAIGVDSIKRTVYNYIDAAPGKIGYCHFPKGRDEEYFSQLLGERLFPVIVRGRRPTLAYRPVHPNVEGLDCRVYGYAAMLFYGHERICEPKKVERVERKPMRIRVRQ